MSEYKERWEMHVQEVAPHFPYPATPDLTRRLHYRGGRKGTPIRPFVRRFAPVAAVLVILTFILLFIPEARARLLEILRIGSVTILDQAPTPGALTPTPLLSALDLPGETTLEQARDLFRLPIRLPTYPADLEAPTRIFTFDRNIVLVWLDASGGVRLTLQLIPSTMQAEKYYPYAPIETEVEGHEAVWLNNVHLTEFFGRNTNVSRVITGNVLIWDREHVTYRLETDLPLAEAVHIAESLH